MAEFQSIFTGQEVDNTINKLRSWIAVDGTYPTVTISGVTYAVIWKVVPVSGKACYGIGLHPTTGRPYEIYYDGSSYTATALDADTHYTNYLQIKGNGTEAVKFTQNADKTLNLKPGNNVAISAASGEITISATDTTYSLVSNATASGGIKYITEVSFTNGVLTLESKYLHLN